LDDFEAFLMCAVFGIASGWWPVSGLIADFVGVSLLGFDLIRVQRMLRANAAAELSRFNAMAEDYGGVESWIKEIRKSTRWVNAHEYSDYQADDEISYNVRRAIEGLSETSECVSALACHLTEIVTLSQQKVEGDSVTAQSSLRLSVIGLALILIGFCGQLIGSLPCT
jgi:hypothetical protein